MIFAARRVGGQRDKSAAPRFKAIASSDLRKSQSSRLHTLYAYKCQGKGPIVIASRFAAWRSRRLAGLRARDWIASPGFRRGRNDEIVSCAGLPSLLAPGK